MGGWQGGLGQFTFFDYQPGSIWDRVAEAYAGPHDMLNSFIWYDSIGNIKAGIDASPLGYIGDIANYTNVLLATPFAFSTLMPPATLDAIKAGAREKR